jgi:hypothetical protein
MLCRTADGRLVRRLDYHSGKWNRLKDDFPRRNAWPDDPSARRVRKRNSGLSAIVTVAYLSTWRG